MPNHILVTSDGASRLREAESFFLSRKSQSLLLGATRSSADEFLRSLTVRHRGFLGVERYALRQYVGWLALPELAAGNRVQLEGLGFRALVARSVQMISRRGDLRYFHAVTEMPGFVRALSATLKELRLNCVNPELLLAGSLSTQDLGMLLREFERQLVEGKLADFAAVLDAAIATLEKDRISVASRLVLLDVMPRTRRERSFLRALLSRCESVCCTVPKADRESVHFFEEALSTAERMTEDPDEKRRLDFLRNRLFRPGSPSEDPEDDSVQFFSAPGEGRECVEIARRIHRMAEEGVPFDEMVVFLRDPLLYQPHLEDAFRRARIPAHFTRGARRPEPSGRAFLALLDCRLEDFSASAFAEYLSLGQVPLKGLEWEQVKESLWIDQEDDAQLVFKTPERSPGSDRAEEGDSEDDPVLAGTLRVPVQWEKLLVEASVVGGKERWRARLDGLRREMEKKRSSESEDESRREYWDRQLVMLKNLADFAAPLIEFLDGMPEEDSWKGWLDCLGELAVRALKNPAPVLDLLSRLRPMGEVGPVGLTEVRQVLAEYLPAVIEPMSESSEGRVLVAAMAEAPGRRFRVVFLPGLAEGLFPKKVLEDPLLLDDLRESLRLPLWRRRDRILQERLLLRLSVAAATGRLYCSYPRLDLLQGRGRVPSLYYLELLRSAQGRMPDLKRLGGREEAGGSRLGWPAPRDPELAIDESEYDLATLDPLLRSSTLGEEGEGRFLLLTNPWLTRSIRARYKRWLRDWSDDDGLVRPLAPEAEALLEKHGPKERSYSPTSLQRFAACPYRFFLYGIVKLQPREGLVAIERMDPLLRGSLVHEVQFLFFQALSDRELLPLDSHRLAKGLELLEDVLEETSERYFDELSPALPRLWETEIEELRIDLRNWLRESIREDSGWVPLHWEFSFGLPVDRGRDTASREEEAVLESGYRLRGSIDLIEQNSATGALRMTDHKTGKPPSPPPRFIGGGEVLQPLLYARAAQMFFEERVEGGRLFYCTQRGEFRSFEIPLSEASVQAVETVLKTVDRAIENRFLPAAPREEACRYCDYRAVCGPYEEIRVLRKRRGPLGGLRRMRGIR